MVAHELHPAPISAAMRAQGRLGFGFSTRFFYLLAAGLVWSVPAFWYRQFLYGLLVWDCVLVAAWFIDLWLLPRAGQITIERRWSGALALDCETQARLIVHSEAHRDREIQCRLRDDMPPALQASQAELRCIVSPSAEGEVVYWLRALRRGDYQTGYAYLRAQSTMRMAERWYCAPLSQAVRIYPNLALARRNTIYLTRSRQIEKEKRRLRLRGWGREFESLREYQDGDEFRDICWRATARRGKLVTRLYTIERSQAVWLVIDTGRLMRARAGNFNKLDFAADAALCLAQLALFSGDRVGLLSYGRRIKQRVGLGHGPAHLRVILEHLAVMQEEAPEPDHLLAASMLLQLQKRRSLVVWLTDLPETAMTPEVVTGVSVIQARNLVLLAAIGEPQLRAKAAAQPESPQQMFEATAAQELVQRREILLARLRDQGALAMEVMPGQLSTAVLNQYLYVKERSLL